MNTFFEIKYYYQLNNTFLSTNIVFIINLLYKLKRTIN